MAAVDDIAGTLSTLRADSLSAVANGAAVSSWADTQGRWSLTPNNTAPVKVAAGLNGQPAVRFGGTNQSLVTTTAPALAGPFSLGFVVRPFSTTGERQLIWQGSGGESSIYQGKWSTYNGQETHALTSPLPSTAGTVLTFEYTGTSATTIVNGATGTPTSGLVGSAGMTGSRMILGTHGSIGRWLDAELYEVRAWNHALTDAEEAAWHSYVQDRYGITVADYVAPTPVEQVTWWDGSTEAAVTYAGWWDGTALATSRFEGSAP